MSTEKSQRESMDGLRVLCADLIEGIDQEKSSIVRDDAMDHTSVFVHPNTIAEAVRRINAVGYATDEDDEEF